MVCPQFRNPRTDQIEILQCVNDLDIAQKLEADKYLGFVRGAHWFRIADIWYRMNHGYNNPLNLGNVNSELLLVHQLRTYLQDLVIGRRFVFFGVGVGDTELAFVDFQLEKSRSSEMILIDINPVFLRMFIYSLARRELELSGASLRYIAINDFFENYSANTLQNKDSSIALVCLGGTVGNYLDSREIFDIFHRVTQPGDRIIIGYQLDTHLEIVFQKYAENGLYRDLIGNFLDPSQKERIKWLLNKKESMVEAWLDEIQLFRSRKFSNNSVRQLTSIYGWHELLCEVDSFNNLCIHAFERK